jgi:hypothetical protein
MGLAPILYIASECQGKQLSKAHSILNKNSGVYFIHFAPTLALPRHFN